MSSRGSQHKLYIVSRNRFCVWAFAGLICLCSALLFLDFQRRSTAVPVPVEHVPLKIPAEELRALHSHSRHNTTEVLEEAQSTRCFTAKCTVTEREEEPDSHRLIIAIVSDPVEDALYRQLARETWVSQANTVEGVRALFFFPASQTGAVAAEVAEHSDILVAQRSDESMPVGFQALAEIAARFSSSLLMRVSARSYIVPGRLLAKLDEVCSTRHCEGERIWAGKQLVTYGTGGTQYKADTGVDDYLPSMSSGAYVLSRPLVNALVLMHDRIGLKTISDDEGISMGLWLIPMPVRRIDLSASFYVDSPCCVLAGDEPRVVVDICAELSPGEPPAVLSVLERPEYVTMFHENLSNCKRRLV